MGRKVIHFNLYKQTFGRGIEFCLINIAHGLRGRGLLETKASQARASNMLVYVRREPDKNICWITKINHG